MNPVAVAGCQKVHVLDRKRLHCPWNPRPGEVTGKLLRIVIIIIFPSLMDIDDNSV